MTIDDQKLVEQCEAGIKTLAGVDEWVRANPQATGSSGEALLRESNRLARALRKEAATAARKMCVGVFGPSQSGKSYLISALAQDADGSLLAALGDESADFIQDINPAGGKESTGLVTRFTLTPSGAPAMFPVKLRLLSELDIVKILTNTYYADCRHLTPPDEDALAARVDALAKKAKGEPWRASFSEDDMIDLKEYVTRNFRATAVVQRLEHLYWPKAIHAAGRLAPEDRAALFEILWDEAKPFTALYLRLSGVLDALGYPDEAFCGKEALLPRETSIIDVETLRGLGETEGADSLELVTKDGRRVAAGRSEIAALTAELAITMRHKPDDFFEHTDLLDFPGYRSRLKTDDVARELAKPDQIRQFFLRGKVAYLFERYKTDLELTSMLLCIGPSNQEVQDLPAVINDWVSDAAGKTPELRQGRHTTLFLVLTKFDMEFEKKKGAVDDETRWSNRLHASLLDFFGKQHDWPEQWTPDQPFNNTYWLRNPKFRWEAVIAFDGDRETGIRPEQEAYVSDMKAKFLNTPEVRRHFADPEAAWNAAFTLNDGGVAFLRRQLRPVCDPAIKRRQVADRVADNLRPFVEHLRRFHRIDDKAALREQQRQLGMRLARSLALTAQNQRFGELLRAMLMRDHELYALYYQVENRLMRENEQAPVPQPSVGSAASAQDIMDDLFGDMAPPVPASAETPRSRWTRRARSRNSSSARGSNSSTPSPPIPSANGTSALKPKISGSLSMRSSRACPASASKKTWRRPCATCPATAISGATSSSGGRPAWPPIASAPSWTGSASTPRPSPRPSAPSSLPGAPVPSSGNSPIRKGIPPLPPNLLHLTGNTIPIGWRRSCTSSKATQTTKAGRPSIRSRTPASDDSSTT